MRSDKLCVALKLSSASSSSWNSDGWLCESVTIVNWSAVSLSPLDSVPAVVLFVISLCVTPSVESDTPRAVCGCLVIDRIYKQPQNDDLIIIVTSSIMHYRSSAPLIIRCVCDTWVVTVYVLSIAISRPSNMVVCCWHGCGLWLQTFNIFCDAKIIMFGSVLFSETYYCQLLAFFLAVFCF